MSLTFEEVSLHVRGSYMATYVKELWMAIAHQILPPAALHRPASHQPSQESEYQA
jgi:hypothetical protein